MKSMPCISNCHMWYYFNKKISFSAKFFYLVMKSQFALCSKTYLRDSMLTRKDNILHLTVMNNSRGKQI